MMDVLGSKIGWAAGLALTAGMISVSVAQDQQHGRKWKPMPPTAHIVVTVVKGFNDKPLPNAAVVFHAVRDGKDDGNLEVKTDPEGKATIDVIEIGSHLTVQVIASGFATSAQDIDVDGPDKALEVKLIRPRAQVSQYQDNDGKQALVKPGTQEPLHNPTPGGASSNPQAQPKAAPLPTNPTQLPGPLNSPAGTVTTPTQPGAPTPVAPPVAPPPTGTPLPSGSPQ